MAKIKTLVIFEAGPGGSRALQDVIRDVLPQELSLEETEVILIPADQWNAVGAINSETLENAQIQSELVARQLAYMEARNWQIKKAAVANAYQDAIYSEALQSLYFLYSFGGTLILEAERKAQKLYVEPVPGYKFRRPGWMMISIGLFIIMVPIILSFIFPHVLGDAWALLDLIVLVLGLVLIWRGGISRLRKAPITQTEKCPGCGHVNRFTNVVKLNCHRCDEEIAYQLRGENDLEFVTRIQSVKCPHCKAVNNLRFRRMVYTCDHCGVRHTLGTSTIDLLEKTAGGHKTK